MDLTRPQFQSFQHRLEPKKITAYFLKSSSSTRLIRRTWLEGKLAAGEARYPQNQVVLRAGRPSAVRPQGHASRESPGPEAAEPQTQATRRGEPAPQPYTPTSREPRLRRHSPGEPPGGKRDPMHNRRNSAVARPDELDRPTQEWLADFEYPIRALVSKPREPMASQDSPIDSLSAPEADWLSAQEFPGRPIAQAAWNLGPAGELRAKDASPSRGRSMALASGSHISLETAAERTSGLTAFWALSDLKTRTGIAGVT
jgi:hypothetical protein